MLSKVIFQIQPIKKSKLFQITNVSRILQIGSILSVKHCYWNFKDVLRNNVRVNPCWKPKAENKTADTLSRLTDTDDWSVDDEIVGYYEKNLGIHTVDGFATH